MPRKHNWDLMFSVVDLYVTCSGFKCVCVCDRERGAHSCFSGWRCNRPLCCSPPVSDSIHWTPDWSARSRNTSRQDVLSHACVCVLLTCLWQRLTCQTHTMSKTHSSPLVVIINKASKIVRDVLLCKYEKEHRTVCRKALRRVKEVKGHKLHAHGVWGHSWSRLSIQMLYFRHHQGSKAERSQGESLHAANRTPSHVIDRSYLLYWGVNTHLQTACVIQNRVLCKTFSNRYVHVRDTRVCWLWPQRLLMIFTCRISRTTQTQTQTIQFTFTHNSWLLFMYLYTLSAVV